MGFLNGLLAIVPCQILDLCQKCSTIKSLYLQDKDLTRNRPPALNIIQRSYAQIKKYLHLAIDRKELTTPTLLDLPLFSTHSNHSTLLESPGPALALKAALHNGLYIYLFYWNTFILGGSITIRYSSLTPSITKCNTNKRIADDKITRTVVYNATDWQSFGWMRR